MIINLKLNLWHNFTFLVLFRKIQPTFLTPQISPFLKAFFSQEEFFYAVTFEPIMQFKGASNVGCLFKWWYYVQISDHLQLISESI